MTRSRFFIASQDSSLRFVESQLAHEADFGLKAEGLRFVGLGAAEHGRVYRDVNGDLCFAAEAGNVGQASFLYQLADAAGRIIARRALVNFPGAWQH